MAKFSAAQTDFSSGELGQKLSARTDLREYKRGLKEMTGFYPGPSGAAVRCPGTRESGSLVGTGWTIHRYEAVTQDSMIVGIKGSAGAFDVELLNKNGAVVGLIFSNGGGGLTVQQEINALNIELERNRYSFAQIGEILFITHTSGLLKPLVLSRVGANFVLDYFDRAENRLGLHPSLSYPFDPYNIGNIEVQSTGGNNLLANAPLFTAEDVGTWFRIKTDTDKEGVFFISAFNDSQNVSYTDFAKSTAYADGVNTKQWSRSTWSQDRGWPKLVSIVGNRTVFANSDQDPTALWFSALANYFLVSWKRYANTMPDSFLGYSGNLIDSDAFVTNVSGGEGKEVRWLSSQRSLHVGTEEGEYAITGRLGAELGFEQRQQTSHGGSFVESAKADRASIYVSKDGTRLRNFLYSEENGAYFSQDLSILSEDIIRHNFDKDADSFLDIRISQIVWDTDRSIVWIVTNDGALCGVSIVPTSDTVGWFSRPIGGDSTVESVAMLYQDDTEFTLPYLAVVRNGNTQIEKIGPGWLHGGIPNASTNIDDLPFFLDASSSSVPGVGGVFGGFDNLIGEDVTCLRLYADRYEITTETVSGIGQITIAVDTPDRIIAGYPYKSKIETMNLEAGAIIGNAQILHKSIEKFMIRLYKSIGGRFGSETSNLKPIEYRDVEEKCTYTGDSLLDFPSSGSEQTQAVIEQHEPLPMTILGIFMRGETRD